MTPRPQGQPSEREEAPTRRAFLASTLRSALALAAVATGARWVTGCGSDNPASPPGDTNIVIDTTLAQFSVLATVGGQVALESGDVPGLPFNGVFIFRVSNNVATVFDRTCTYQEACQVDPYLGSIATCPCSGSEYNTDGIPVVGPALFPLLEYPSTVNGSLIEFTV